MEHCRCEHPVHRLERLFEKPPPDQEDMLCASCRAQHPDCAPQPERRTMRRRDNGA